MCDLILIVFLLKWIYFAEKNGHIPYLTEYEVILQQLRRMCFNFVYEYDTTFYFADTE
jgi:hypothetical protein